MRFHWQFLLGAALVFCGAAVQTTRAAEPDFVGVLAWALDDAAAEKLKLTEEQRAGLLKIVDEREGKAIGLAVQLKDLPAAERQEKLAPFRLESETQGLALLNEQQKAVLEQIRLEKLGPSVLMDQKMADALALNEGQKAEIAKLLATRATDLAGADEKKARIIRGYSDRKILAQLDADQRAKWDQMTGQTPAEAQPATTEKPETKPTEPGTPSSKPAADAATPAPIRRPTTTKSPDGKIRFNFRFQPWGDVLDWFSQQADLSLVMDVAPPGTFNYTDSRSYTPTEAIDLLNSVLLTKGYLVVRRERMLVVLNQEDGLPPYLVSDIPLADLDKRGEYEFVSVLFRLERLTPEEAEQEIRRVLGPQGSIVTFPKSGFIRVTETAGRLRMIRNVLHGIEGPEGTSTSALRVFELKHAELNDALGMIRQLLDIPADGFASSDGSIRMAIDPASGKVLVTGKLEKIARFDEIMKVVDVPVSRNTSLGSTAIETPQLEVYGITAADAASVLAVLQTLLANNPDVRLAIDPKTGHLVALARPSQHATIRATLEQMQRDARRVEVIRLTRVDPQTAVLSINKLFSADIEGGAANAPKVDADPVSRNLLIRANESQLTQIRSLLEKMGEAGTSTTAAGGTASSGGGNVRMLPYNSRTARAALEQLEQVWSVTRQNKIRVVTPSAVVPALRAGESSNPATQAPGGETLDAVRPGVAPSSAPMPLRKPAVEEKPPAAAPAARDARRPDDRSSAGATGTKRTTAAIFVKQPEGKSDEQADEPVKGQPPAIIVAPGTNSLMIASEDTEALDEFEALLATFASRQFAGGQQYTIYYLANANCTVVAETLEAIFGAGPVASSGGGGSLLGDIAGSVLGGGASGGLVSSLLNLGGSSGGSSTASTGSVSIIPETRLNALIVQASPGDLDTIELLLKILDQAEVPESGVSPKPRMIAVKNTSATQIAEIIREVYQEKMVSANRQRQPSPEEFIQLLRGGGGGSSGGRGGSSGGSRGRNAAADAQKMTVGVDTRTNSLIVAAPQQLFDEVKQMVETLDTATSENNTAVKVVALQRSNASTVQKALSAIAGEKVRGGQVADTSSSGGGSSGSRSSSEADQMRQRIEMFNSLRGGSSGGSPFGGGGGSPFGGFGSRGGDSGGSRTFGSGGFPGGSSGGSRDSSRGSGR